MLEFKRFPLEEVKAGPSDGLEEGEFSGYLAVFGNVDEGGDVILPGAFERTLKEQADRIQLHFQHKWDDLPIGVFKELQEDERGLRVRAKVSDTQMGRDILTLMRDGALKEMSIGYGVTEGGAKMENGVRYLLDLDLFEGSVVTRAMNEQALVAAVKDAYHHLVRPEQEAKEYEEADPSERYWDDVDEAVSTAGSVEEVAEGILEALEAAEELTEEDITDTVTLLEAITA